MEITEITVTLRNEEKLKAFVNVTFDDQFVIRGMKIIKAVNPPNQNQISLKNFRCEVKINPRIRAKPIAKNVLPLRPRIIMAKGRPIRTITNRDRIVRRYVMTCSWCARGRGPARPVRTLEKSTSPVEIST